MSKTIEELASKYVEDVYGGDTDFIYETEDVLSWLFNKPLAQRLTDAEKEMVRKEFADTYPNDPDNSISSTAIGAVLKRIFGKDFFENNNYEEDNV